MRQSRSRVQEGNTVWGTASLVSDLSCKARGASARGRPRRPEPLWSRTSASRLKPRRPPAPAPRHGVVTRELPCCSLTHWDIIRDSGQKNNTSQCSLGLSQEDPEPSSWQMSFSWGDICIWHYAWGNIRNQCRTAAGTSFNMQTVTVADK